MSGRLPFQPYGTPPLGGFVFWALLLMMLGAFVALIGVVGYVVWGWL